MGLNLGNRCKSSPYAIANSNPDPKHFNILSECIIEKCLILQVRYPDARNFEGKKILVYLGFKTSRELLKATGGILDPHFAESKTSPLARFQPTIQGYKAAIQFASIYCDSPSNHKKGIMQWTME